MLFTVYKGEKTVHQLVTRLFHISGPGATKATKEAADLLMKANPQLKDLKSVPRGVRIVVPDAPFTINHAELSPVTATPAPAEQLRQGLENLPDSIAASTSAAVAQADAVLAIVQRPELRRAAAKDPVLAESLASIAEQTKATIKQVQSRHTALQDAIARVQKDIARVWKT